MKTLYFVGNEELWGDAWFTALLESLKSHSISTTLYDPKKDAEEIKKVAEKLSAYERMLFAKNLNPENVLSELGASLNEGQLSLVYVFSDIVNANAVPKQIAWGADELDFLKTTGLWEGSQVIEDAFIFDVNLASEVSRAIEENKGSLIDGNLLMADADQLASMIEHSEKESVVEEEPNIEVKVPELDKKEQVTAIDEIESEVVAVHAEDDTVVPSAGEKTELVASEEMDSLEDIFDEEMGLAADLPNEVDNKEENVDLSLNVASEQKTKVIQPVSLEADEELSIEQAVKPPEQTSPLGFGDAEDKSKAGLASSVEVSQLISAMSPSVSSEDMEVLKRYSSIKERELRESQAAAEALRRQIKYFDERLKKSEEERRKLILKLEETDNELRTVADKKDENRAQLKGIESRYEEKIKELSVQLESAQFQAGKLDKKLIDFRERVRNDLQKIRSRERELASRLEIQKRDAEALLSAKDERLLNQKREMDRLEFDLDAFKERLMEEASKSEERRKRVGRALQSLKLAQSILSGLEEDVMLQDDKDKAA
ncbi:MAG: hypothetical protein R3A80_04930 [Bdellovibrionota bacterium]